MVGRLEGALTDSADAEDLALACNVVFSTPDALHATNAEVRASFLSHFDMLFVDEAHHVAAPTWNQVRDSFAPKPVVQFTATPHRTDGQHLGGSLVYAFPLREAQRAGYFAPIRYKSVLSLEDPDRAIADTALGFLRSDLAAGLDHLLMARANTVKKAAQLTELYRALAPDLEVVLVHHELGAQARRAALARVAGPGRSARILVCVDMFGEGFDLPQLKIAALHDPHRSLGVTLQFIGRFARSGAVELGSATVVAARSEVRFDDRLRRLYAEDADWNELVDDLSAEALEDVEELDQFAKAFSSQSEGIAVHSLTPAMSAVVFQPSTGTWEPESLVDTLIPRDELVTYPIPVNRRDGVAWFVTRTSAQPRWGSVPDTDSVSYDLYVLFWDANRGLLFVNSSNNDSVHEELARQVSGDDEVAAIAGERVYRVFHNVQRLTPTNVGLVDARNRNRRYTNYVGSDVTEAFPAAEAQTKSQTHIAGVGYLHGMRYSIAASIKGRVWSHRTARDLREWTLWCDEVGSKILDGDIDVDAIMAGFIRPVDIDHWPNLVALALELPQSLVDSLGACEVTYEGQTASMHELEFQIRGRPQGRELPIAVVAPLWRADYVLVLTQAGLKVRPPDEEGPEVYFHRPRGAVSFSSLIRRSGIRVLLEAESIVEPPGVLLTPNRELAPFLRTRLTPLDWNGANIRKESWGDERDPLTVQGQMVARLGDLWDVVIDDDGSGEIADLVAFSRTDGHIKILLVHCKYSSHDVPGARLGDLYELAGQAQRSAGWRRDVTAMFAKVISRERLRLKRGNSGFVRGKLEDVMDALDATPRATIDLEIALAQPGLSARQASVRQLELLSSVELYVSETAMSKIAVYCSE